MVKNASSKNDATLREFETKDLGTDLKAAQTAVVVSPGSRAPNPRKRLNLKRLL